MYSYFSSYQDRAQAGKVLGGLLSSYAGSSDVIVLALPRDGVPVGFEVAQAIGAPLDLLLVRKLRCPRHPSVTMGAVASGGVRILNDDVIGTYSISREEIEEATRVECRELGRREQAYRGENPPMEVAGRTVILVDDGLATGSTMRAAVEALRKREPARLVAAVPVAAPESAEALRSEVDDLVAAYTPVPFFSVGRWYRDFSPTMDREIRRLLERAAPKQMAAS